MTTTNKIAVEVNGTLVLSTEGHVSCDDPVMLDTIKRNARLRNIIQIVRPFGAHVYASLDPDDPIGNLAALISPDPGRWVVKEVPDAVQEWLIEQDSPFETGEDNGIHLPDMSPEDVHEEEN